MLSLRQCSHASQEPVDERHGAIRAFTAESQLCYEGNRAMRSYPDPCTRDEALYAKYHKFEELLDWQLTQLPAFQGTVYRAIDYKMPFLTGEILTFLQPSSSSLDPRVVKGFLGNKRDVRPTGMIFVVDSLHGRHVAHLSDYPEEDEVYRKRGRMLGCVRVGVQRSVWALRTEAEAATQCSVAGGFPELLPCLSHSGAQSGVGPP